jgi:hypothetical protein
MGIRAQIRAQSGTSGTQKAQPPALIKSPAKMGRYRCDKKANEDGDLTAQVRKINNSIRWTKEQRFCLEGEMP